MPCSCAASSASAICLAICSAWRRGSGPWAIRSASVGAVDELQHEPVRGAGVLEAVDVTDVRVIQRREHLRFALEAREPIRIARDRCRQDFDRDVAIQLRVAGAIDFAHAAGADGGQDLYGPSRVPAERATRTFAVCERHSL